ncbi:MAG: putative quinol monooxygenase [Nocardioides sp.]
MAADTVCTLVPYFTIKPGQEAAFRAAVPAFVERTATERGCVHYAFSFDGDHAHCREGYDDAEGVLAHLENVGALLQELLKIADIARLEVHGPAEEVDKLREPLADLNPQFFVLEPGGLRR